MLRTPFELSRKPWRGPASIATWPRRENRCRTTVRLPGPERNPALVLGVLGAEGPAPADRPAPRRLPGGVPALRRGHPSEHDPDGGDLPTGPVEERRRLHRIECPETPENAAFDENGASYLGEKPKAEGIDTIVIVGLWTDKVIGYMENDFVTGAPGAVKGTRFPDGRRG